MDFKRVNVIWVDYDALEKYIAAQYERKFDFLFDQEEDARNMSVMHFRVDGELSEEDYNNIREWQQNPPEEERLHSGGIMVKWEYGEKMTRTLLNDLCRQGKIPAGDYIIKIFY